MPRGDRGVGASGASPRPAHTGVARPSRPHPTGVLPVERIPPEGCTHAGAESTPPARTRRKLPVRCVPITPGPSVTSAVRPASAAPTGLIAWELKSLAPANFRVPRQGAGGLLRSRDTRRVAGYVRIQAGRITFGQQTPECGAPERASRLSPRTGERHRRSPGNRSRRFRRCGSWIRFVDVAGHDDGTTGPGRPVALRRTVRAGCGVRRPAGEFAQRVGAIGGGSSRGGSTAPCSPPGTRSWPATSRAGRHTCKGWRRAHGLLQARSPLDRCAETATHRGPVRAGPSRAEERTATRPGAGPGRRRRDQVRSSP